MRLPGVDRHLAAAVRVDLAHPDLQQPGLVGRQHQWRLQHQLVHHRRAELLAGRRGQLHQGGAGHHHGAEHRVVGQPRLRLRRHPAGEHPLVAVAERHDRGEQRVVEPAGCRRRPRRRPPRADRVSIIQDWNIST
ncbi:hypothetical protein ADL15_22660 [Actinoplanes awajinensis subsp. mycoplanecinus]|uniref:Uncharacterized protein n=1 Tax=Actinoplanes awajinensis subsp. mycoplanecinus TaxID=135947 RepID=A0A124GA65_9ACTN|nr:hypothetical protein ADL15_22660 [Actinoplanes awajinensis subsp. mycoplanecinus]